MSYATVAGLRTYYETHGTGDPVLLLHGGLATADSWAPQIAALSEQYQVIVPERRGHGRTGDVDGRYTYRLMAADTIGFAETLGLASAHVVGWSDGALVGAYVALDRPDLVEKLVLIGQYLDPSGARPELASMLDDGDFGEFARPGYDRLSPDGPEHFDVVLAKILRMWREDPGPGLSALPGITAPTLVMQGDDDFVTVEHSAAVARALPEAQLAVVPGTSHGLPMEKPALVNQLLLDFLGGEHPTKLAPLTP
ncbi:alpha/beta fold hydrolase [Cryptosporangium aurantiacum]|nr:alpha/beta hydrolase [Cryptosporangium aurantiacum]